MYIRTSSLEAKLLCIHKNNYRNCMQESEAKLKRDQETQGIEPEEAPNQQSKDGQDLTKEMKGREKEECNKQNLKMPSSEEMKEIEKEQSLKVTG